MANRYMVLPDPLGSRVVRSGGKAARDCLGPCGAFPRVRVTISGTSMIPYIPYGDYSWANPNGVYEGNVLPFYDSPGVVIACQMLTTVIRNHDGFDYAFNLEVYFLIAFERLWVNGNMYPFGGFASDNFCSDLGGCFPVCTVANEHPPNRPPGFTGGSALVEWLA